MSILIMYLAICRFWKPAFIMISSPAYPLFLYFYRLFFPLLKPGLLAETQQVYRNLWPLIIQQKMLSLFLANLSSMYSYKMQEKQ